MAKEKEITRLLKKRVLFSGTRYRDGSTWETIGTRKDRRHKYSGLRYTRSKRTSFYKKQSNKVVRRTKNISSGNNYRKAFDYQRTID